MPYSLPDCDYHARAVRQLIHALDKALAVRAVACVSWRECCLNTCGCLRVVTEMLSIYVRLPVCTVVTGITFIYAWLPACGDRNAIHIVTYGKWHPEHKHQEAPLRTQAPRTTPSSKSTHDNTLRTPAPSTTKPCSTCTRSTAVVSQRPRHHL